MPHSQLPHQQAVAAVPLSQYPSFPPVNRPAALLRGQIHRQQLLVIDTMEAVKRGIMRTPALVIDGKVLCAGRVPKYEEVVGWLSGSKS
ncbi:MAG: thioredoxin family protein [Peptococcaceae bacterium]|nr:thioredoxin family protein [Peptococcaceae bacterium]